MATLTRKKTTARRDDLRAMLLKRQLELQNEVRTRMEDMRAAGPPSVPRGGDDSDADAQQDIELAMIQLRAEASRQVTAALARLEAGDYGNCAVCGDEIPQKRLQALIFAIRCMACEQARERGNAEERRTARDQAGVALFPNAARY